MTGVHMLCGPSETRNHKGTWQKLGPGTDRPIRGHRVCTASPSPRELEQKRFQEEPPASVHFLSQCDANSNSNFTKPRGQVKAALVPPCTELQVLVDRSLLR